MRPDLPMPDSPLRYATPLAWTEAVMADFDAFLLDHAAAEKKASGMAISMLSHYPDRVELVAAMAELAVEELTHYREVVKWIHRRGLLTAADRKDHYVLALRNAIRTRQRGLPAGPPAHRQHHRGPRGGALRPGGRGAAAGRAEKILPVDRPLGGAPLSSCSSTWRASTSTRR